MYRLLGVPLKGRGITVIRLDHAGKDVKQGQRGTSAKNDDVDIVWQLTRQENGTQMKATHRRVGWVPALVNLDRLTEPVRYVPSRDAEIYPAGTKEVAAVMDRLGLPLSISRRKAAAALRDAGEGKGSTIIAAALRWRQAELPTFPKNLHSASSGPRTTSDQASGPVVPDHFGEMASDLPRTTSRTTQDHLAGQVGTSGGVCQDTPWAQPQPAELDYDPDDPNNSII